MSDNKEIGGGGLFTDYQRPPPRASTALGLMPIHSKTTTVNASAPGAPTTGPTDFSRVIGGTVAISDEVRSSPQYADWYYAQNPRDPRTPPPLIQGGKYGAPVRSSNIHGPIGSPVPHTNNTNASEASAAIPTTQPPTIALSAAPRPGAGAGPAGASRYQPPSNRALGTGGPSIPVSRPPVVGGNSRPSTGAASPATQQSSSAATPNSNAGSSSTAPGKAPASKTASLASAATASPSVTSSNFTKNTTNTTSNNPLLTALGRSSAKAPSSIPDGEEHWTDDLPDEVPAPPKGHCPPTTVAPAAASSSATTKIAASAAATASAGLPPPPPAPPILVTSASTTAAFAAAAPTVVSGGQQFSLYARPFQPPPQGTTSALLAAAALGPTAAAATFGVGATQHEDIEESQYNAAMRSINADFSASDSPPLPGGVGPIIRGPTVAAVPAAPAVPDPTLSGFTPYPQPQYASSRTPIATSPSGHGNGHSHGGSNTVSHAGLDIGPYGGLGIGPDMGSNLMDAYDGAGMVGGPAGGMGGGGAWYGMGPMDPAAGMGAMYGVEGGPHMGGGGDFSPYGNPMMGRGGAMGGGMGHGGRGMRGRGGRGGAMMGPMGGVGMGGRGGGRGLANSAAAPVRSPFVEKFHLEHAAGAWRLEDVEGHIAEIAKDQEGSRFVQVQLEAAAQNGVLDKQLSAVLDELFVDQATATDVICDVFGNYVVQKILEVASEDALARIFNNLRGIVVSLTLQTYGCRVIQKAVESLRRFPKLLEAVVAELEPNVPRCVQDQNGNHVIQKLVEINPDGAGFIIDAFRGKVRELATHAYGCRVIQCILSQCPRYEPDIMRELFVCLPELTMDQYGNYVVQHVLQNGPQAYVDVCFDALKHRIYYCSRQKFASNVIERLFQRCSRQQRQELFEILCYCDPDVGATEQTTQQIQGKPLLSYFVLMMMDPFANYVVQKFVDEADEGLRRQMMAHTTTYIDVLRAHHYGMHIINRFERSRYLPLDANGCLPAGGNGGGPSHLPNPNGGHSHPNNGLHSNGHSNGGNHNNNNNNQHHQAMPSTSSAAPLASAAVSGNNTAPLPHGAGGNNGYTANTNNGGGGYNNNGGHGGGRGGMSGRGGRGGHSYTNNNNINNNTNNSDHHGASNVGNNGGGGYNGGGRGGYRDFNNNNTNNTNTNNNTINANNSGNMNGPDGKPRGGRGGRGGNRGGGGAPRGL